MKKDPRRFYVYAYLRSVDSEHGKAGSPYYIGKGSGNRISSKQGRPVNKPVFADLVVYIQEGLTEEEAFRLEEYCIALYGRVDVGTGCLRNKSNGGEGASGVVMTEQRRQKISLMHKGKTVSEETRRKIGAAGRGRKLSVETKAKMSASRTGSKNHFFNKRHSEEFKSRRSIESATHKYELTSPNGEIHVTHSLTLFAKEHGLRQGCLSLVANGRRNHHKGWKCRIIEALK
jgi:hypothetical protein